MVDFGPKLVDPGPNSVDAGPTSVEIGRQTCAAPMMDILHATLLKPRSKALCRPLRSRSGPFWSNLGPNLANMGRIRPTSADSGAVLVQSRPMSANMRSTFVQIWPCVVDTGPELDEFRRKYGQFCPSPGRTRPKLGRNRHKSGRKEASSAGVGSGLG